MRSLKFGVLGVLLGAVMVVGCDNTNGGSKEPVSPESIINKAGDAGTTQPTFDAGQQQTVNDAGTGRDAGTSTVDAGATPDAGAKADAGMVADAGTPVVDAGNPEADAGPAAIAFPNSPGWTFYGPQDGLPAHVNGITADEGGNIWIAGGEAGLFLIRAGSTTIERFTMADGLRPYGFMADGSVPPGPKYLNVLAVEGGPAGTVFVGYQGRSLSPQNHCEGNWDSANPDPSIYKSGDADKVALTTSGISVVHYDIFSGPNVVGDEPQGREKLCEVHSLLWDKAAGRIWFGANHGFAMGNANYTGNNTCNGQLSCAGVLEHIHPLVTGFSDAQRTQVVTLSGTYRAMDLYSNNDVFVGADVRSTRFKFGGNGGLASPGNAYFAAQPQSENDTSNHFDIWPDAFPEPYAQDPATDLVFGVANNGDDTFWVGSGKGHGLAHVSSSGQVLGLLKTELISPYVSRVARDPSDGSIWAGGRYGGISRVSNGTVTKYGWQTLGVAAGLMVSDVQAMPTTGGRKMLISFDSETGKGGAIGIYSGN